MSGGYQRVTASTWGRGAEEVVGALLAEVSSTTLAQDQVRVGSVFEVYDRSMYLEFDRDLTTGVSVPGPRLVLLGGSTVAGPLTIELDTPDGSAFDPQSVETGAAIGLHRSAVQSPEPYVLSIGGVIELEFEAPTPTDTTVPRGDGLDIDAVTRGSPVWEAGKATVEWLVDAGFDDGLGWMDALAGVGTGTGGDHELHALADGWGRYLEGATTDIPPAVRDILGRGPGATPAGDDITAGILVTLLATTGGRRRNRVVTAGEALVSMATDRTTTISAALLAQASQGRVAPPVATGLSVLLSPAVTESRRLEAVEAVADHGHTSGVDLLVGMLTTVLLIGPRLAADGG